MEVKGTAFLARKAMAEREHGPARFAEVVREAAARDPVFASPILATTRLPIEAFLRFNDAMVRMLYRGDEQSYFGFGEQSAAWALTEGPYKKLVTEKSVAQFVASAPAIYRNYYDAGEAASVLRGDVVELRLSGIEAPYRHVYFEYAIMGYFKRGLEMVSGGRVTMRARRGFSRGDPDVFYEFRLG